MKNCAAMFFICALFSAVDILKAMEVEKALMKFSDTEIADWRNIETLLNVHGSTYAQTSDSQGNTPLHQLLENYYFEKDYTAEFKNKVGMLLQHGALLTAENNEGETPIHTAARNGREYFLRSFLSLVSVADINKADRKGLTALDKVFSRTFPINNGAIEQLVVHGGVTLAADTYAYLNIHKDACNGLVAWVKLSYARNSNLLNSTHYSGGPCFVANLTPLNAAVTGLFDIYDASNGIQKVVAFLLEKRASVVMADSDGNIPLHHAAHSRTDKAGEVLTMLLNHADYCVNSQNKAGDTPLHRAIHEGESYVKHADLLIKHNAQLDMQNNAGKTALYSAVEQGCKEMVTLLLEKRASCMVSDVKGTFPIHIAANGLVKNASAIADLLIRNNAACIDVCDVHGDTPLHKIVLVSEYSYTPQREQCEAIARTLLLNGAQRDIPNKKGERALNSATRLNNRTLVELLTVDIDVYKGARKHNTELMRKTATLLGVDIATIEQSIAYQRLLDFRITDTM